MPGSALLNIMVKAARKAGRSLARDFGEVENLQVSVKGPADFVSNADRRAEEIVHEELSNARPTYSFLMEESGETKGSDGQHRFIVDPLDGTTNFLHSIPIFACAIALERNGEIVASVVHNPIMDETFTAERGGGAWLNDRARLRVGNRKRLSDCVSSTGIKLTGTKRDAQDVRQVASLTPALAGIRRMGSASIDMAWVAAGRFDLFWESGLAPWDIAPGLCLIREAGGFVSDFAGGEKSMDQGEVICGNQTVQSQLLKEIRKIG